MWESNPPPACLEPDTGFEVREAHRVPRRFRSPPSVPSGIVNPDGVAASPWRLGGLSPTDVARRVHARLRQHEVFDRAASLSYYFLFALFPTLLFLTALLGLLPIPKLMDRLLDYITRMLPGDAASLLTRTLAEVVKGARGSVVSQFDFGR